MKAMLTNDRLTPLEAKLVARATRAAYEKVCGRTPSNTCLALLVAQSALETGRWKSIHCYNFGNVKASKDYDGLYCQFRCNEVINGKLQWFDPPHPQTNFRAFLSLGAGALDHIEFLSKRKRYAHAWEAAHTGMPLTFVEALKSAGYFTADAKPYALAVASLWREYSAMLNQDLGGDSPWTTEPSVTLEECNSAMTCVAPDPERALHNDAVIAMMNFDPLAAARRERIEQMKEPDDVGT